jgi:hypothetical protein
MLLSGATSLPPAALPATQPRLLATWRPRLGPPCCGLPGSLRCISPCPPPPSFPQPGPACGHPHHRLAPLPLHQRGVPPLRQEVVSGWGVCVVVCVCGVAGGGGGGRQQQNSFSLFKRAACQWAGSQRSPALGVARSWDTLLARGHGEPASQPASQLTRPSPCRPWCSARPSPPLLYCPAALVYCRVNHFDPWSPIFSKRERLEVAVSDAALLAVLYGLRQVGAGRRPVAALVLLRVHAAPCAHPGQLLWAACAACQPLLPSPTGRGHSRLRSPQHPPPQASPCPLPPPKQQPSLPAAGGVVWLGVAGQDVRGALPHRQRLAGHHHAAAAHAPG